MKLVQFCYVLSFTLVINGVAYSSASTTKLQFMPAKTQGADLVIESEFEPADLAVPENLPTLLKSDLIDEDEDIKSTQIHDISQRSGKVEELRSIQVGLQKKSQEAEENKEDTCLYKVGKESEPRQPIYYGNVNDRFKKTPLQPKIVDGELAIDLKITDTISFFCHGPENELVALNEAKCSNSKELQFIVRDKNPNNGYIVLPDANLEDNVMCYDPLIPTVIIEKDRKTHRVGYKMPFNEKFETSGMTKVIEESKQLKSEVPPVPLKTNSKDWLTVISIRINEKSVVTFHKINGAAIRSRQKFYENSPSEENIEKMWQSKCQLIQKFHNDVSQLQNSQEIMKSECQRSVQDYSKKNQMKKLHRNDLAFGSIPYDMELNNFDAMQMAPHQDMILIREKYASFYYHNILRIWHTFRCTWAGLEEMIRYVAAEFKTEVTVYTGVDEYKPLKFHREIEFYWKVYHDATNKAAIAFVMYHDPTLTREIIQNTVGELCQSICDQVYWYVGNNDPETGYILCCDVYELKDNHDKIIRRTNRSNDKHAVSSLTAVSINYSNVPLGNGGGELKSKAEDISAKSRILGFEFW